MTTTITWTEGRPQNDGRYLLMMRDARFKIGGYVIDAFVVDGVFAVLPGGPPIKDLERIVKYSQWPQYQES